MTGYGTGPDGDEAPGSHVLRADPGRATGRRFSDSISELGDQLRLDWPALVTATGLVLSLLGDVVLLLWSPVLEPAGGFQPVPVHAGHLLGSVFLGAGVLALVGRKVPSDRAGVLDAAMITSAVAVLAWVLVGGATSGLAPAVQLAAVTHALLVALLLGAVARVLIAPQPATTTGTLLLVSLALALLAELIRLSGLLGPGTAAALAAGLQVAATGCAFPAVLGVRGAPGTGDPEPAAPVHVPVVRRLLLVAVWSSVPLVLGIETFRGRDVDAPVLMLGSVTLIALAAVRVSHLAGDVVAERDRRRADVRFHAAFDHALVGMALIATSGTERGRLVEVNQRLCEILARPPDDLVGRPLTTLLATESQRELREALGRLGDVAEIELAGDHRLLAAPGHSVWGRVGLAAAEAEGERYAVVQVEDVSQRRRAQQRLQYQATHDPLTGLANRMLLADRIEHALNRRTRHGSVATLVIDLDRFKQVNDTLGHAAGDQVLRIVGQRLSAALRPEDTVARVGGDEFVVLLEDLDDVQEASAVADRIAQSLAEPISLASSDVTVAVSTGIAVAGPGDTTDTLFRNADLAMYRAKQNGRARAERYDAGLREVATRRVDTERWLREAVDGGRLHLAMQPVVDLNNGETVGYEALVRCHHPRRGILAPAEFLRVAEDSGLIVPIGRWVMRAALERAAGWHGVDDAVAPTVVVNVSGRQVLSPRFCDQVESMLEDADLPPTRLSLDMTEDTFMEALGSTGYPLQRLHDLGIGIALDDFGTGRSSLAHLGQVPVSTLKIAPSFTSGVLERPRGGSLVQALIQLARALGLRTVAEGVETPQQRQALRDYGCDLGQGYLLGRPTVVPADQFA